MSAFSNDFQRGQHDGTSCMVYLRSGRLHAHAISFDEAGTGMDAGPRFIADSLQSGEVGTAVFSALNGTRRGLAMPENMASLQKDLLTFTGAKSWLELTRTAVAVQVDRDNGIISVTRQEAVKGKRFAPDGDPILCADSDAVSVGRTVLDALGC